MVDHGLFKADKKWVKYIAQINLNDIEALTKGWFLELQNEYTHKDIQVTADAIHAVKDLFYLCEYAISQRKAVFHYWIG